MDKSLFVDRYATTPEQRMLFSHLLDLMLRSENRNTLTVSDFMADADRLKVIELLNAIKCKNYFLYGGYEGAERYCAVFLPDYLSQEDVTFAPSMAEITFVKATVSRFDLPDADLSHRDVLGSLMGLGIERDAIGDIVVEGSTAIFVVKSKLSAYIKDNLTKISRYKVEIELHDNYELTPQIDYVIDSDTVSSMRLDAVVASVFHLSRGNSCDSIHAGLVSLNGAPLTKIDHTIKSGDKIALRGKGKIVIDSIDGMSKKGRLRFQFRKYR